MPLNPDATPRRLSSPDIQALAKIDRILGRLSPEMANATLDYLVATYRARWAQSMKPKSVLPYPPEEE